MNTTTLHMAQAVPAAADRLPAQSPDALFWIRILLSGIPIIGLVLALALIAILRFPLTEGRMDEIRKQLKAMRGKA